MGTQTASLVFPSILFGQILGYDLEDVIAKGPEEKLETQEAPGDPYSLTFYDL